MMDMPYKQKSRSGQEAHIESLLDSHTSAAKGMLIISTVTSMLRMITSYIQRHQENEADMLRNFMTSTPC